MRKRTRTVVVTASLCLAAAGCGSSEGSGASGGESIKVALPTSVTSFPNSDIAVAVEEGYFKEFGIEVETTNLSSGASSVKGVVSGSFDIGGASIEPVINSAVAGGDLRIIGSYTDRLEVQLVTPKSITEPEDLEGEKVGVQEIGAFREVMTRLVLEGAGLTQEDVEYLPTRSDAYTSALVQGRIKSAILHPEQSVAVAAEDPDLHALVDLYDVEPNYYYGTYFVSQQWLDENKDTAEAFMYAITKAHRFMRDNKDEVVPTIAEETGFSDDVIAEAYETYLTKIEAFPMNEGLDEARLTYTVERMKELGTLAGDPPDMNELVDRGPVEAAVEDLGREPGRAP